MPPGSHGPVSPVRADITRVDVVQSFKIIMSWHKHNKVVVTIWLREQKLYRLYSTIHPLTQVYPPFVFHQVTVIRTAHEVIPVPQGGCHNWALRLCPLAGSTRQPISGKTLRWPFTLELIPKAAQKHPAKPREEILERRLSAKSHCLIQVRSVCNYLKFTITIKDGATKVKLTVHRQNCKQISVR